MVAPEGGQGGLQPPRRRKLAPLSEDKLCLNFFCWSEFFKFYTILIAFLANLTGVATKIFPGEYPGTPQFFGSLRSPSVSGALTIPCRPLALSFSKKILPSVGSASPFVGGNLAPPLTPSNLKVTHIVATPFTRDFVETAPIKKSFISTNSFTSYPKPKPKP